MTSLRRSGQGTHSPGRRPRPLEIILTESNGDRESGFFPVSLRLPTFPDADLRLTLRPQPIVLVFTYLWHAQQSVLFGMPPLISLISSSLNPSSSPHVPRVPSSSSPNYQLPSGLRSSTKPVGNPNRRSASLQLSPKFSPLFSARSQRSLLLPQYSPSLPGKSPESAASFVTSPLSYAPIENEKATLDEDWDYVCLGVDLMDVEADSEKSFWVKAYRYLPNFMLFGDLIKFAYQHPADLPRDPCYNLGTLLRRTAT